MFRYVPKRCHITQTNIRISEAFRIFVCLQASRVYDKSKNMDKIIKSTTKYALYISLPIAAIFISLFVGRYNVSFNDVVSTLGGFFTGKTAEEADVSTECWSVVTQLRLPRLLASAVVGAALAASGGAYQGIFRNPLVSPGILGVSAGAGFGAALAIVTVGAGAATYGMAFVGGIGAVLLSYWIAGIYRSAPTVMLVLGGTIVQSVFNALISLLKYTADADSELPAIVYWLMGSLSSVGWKTLPAAIPAILGIIIMMCCSWRINVLAMGDREARTLGVDVRRTKFVIIAGATLATASAVCMSGVVGWVGLVIPHISRMIVGHDARKMLPLSVSVGAVFMVIIDTVSRSVTASELPLSILTSLIGAPFFVFLLKKTKGGGWM